MVIDNGSQEITEKSTQVDKTKMAYKSGKPSSKTGERYLPERLLKAMTASEYVYETRKKRKAKKAGKQQS